LDATVAVVDKLVLRPGLRAWVACSSASRTKLAVAEVLTFQPTIRQA